MTEEQKKTALELLWDYLPKDKSNPDRVQTGWGSKTKQGLIACLESLQESKQEFAGITVFVYGGLVQSIHTNKPDSVDVDVIDTDRSSFETQEEKEEIDERVKAAEAIEKDPEMICIY